MAAITLFKTIIATCSFFFAAVTSFAAPPSTYNQVQAALPYLDAELTKSSAALYPRVLARVRDGKKNEIFWLSGIRKAGDFYTGKLETAPVQIANVELGQTISVAKKDILDWSYQDPISRKIYGNYGVCMELQALPAEEQLERMTFWGLECKPAK
ncbi:DUF2314 domain-containing protein [Undibacterium sp. Ji42W]|uniref:DUF2314 domain-containing protein n=1 Tax=Undibacterium sp. Ji42W TaxID=3413039 RepID=UPI003BF1A9F5